MRTGRAIRRRYLALLLSTISLLTLVTALGVTMLHPQVTKAADLSSTYTWKQLKIGGGGFVTGIAIHPTTAGVIYVRTDVGGAYRWNASTETWTQLLTIDAVANPNHGDYNVESIAVSKSNDQVVYMAAGTTWDIHNNPPTGRILKSTNRGSTWADSGHRWPMNGNAEYRQGAERLAVDPNNGNVVYFGSRTQGLWVSTDGAANWSQVSTSQIPIGSNSDVNHPVGVKFVMFDPNSGTTGGKTNRIYAGVAGNGIYMSSDAGANWSKILADSTIPFSASLGPDGTFYTAFIGSNQVQKYTPGTNTWTNITPGGEYIEIAVDPFNAQRIFVVSGSGQLWRSTDGGAHWDGLNFTVSSPDIPWIVNTDEKNYMSSAQILFDPVTPNTLWFPQGTGVWQATNLSDSTINWVFKSKGIEETVTSDVIAPPGGNPVTGILDRNGFYHGNVDGYPQKPNLTDKFSAGMSLDYSGGNPSFIASVSSDTRNLNPDQSGYSTDGGQTWTQFSGSRNYGDLYGGNIAVSATDTNNIVWLPTNNKKPYYTTNRGATWTQGTGGLNNVGETHRMIWWSHKKALDADKVNGGTFYLYGTSNGGQFYRSTDGGQSWTQSTGTVPTSDGNDAHVFGQVHAVPGYAGHVWVSVAQSGLFYATDGGNTWTKVNGVQEATAFGFGKPVGGQPYPAVYIHGKVNDQTGIWRSVDQGVSWDLAAQYPLGIYDTVSAVSGDMNIAGRVYVGFGGNGFSYGDSSAVGTIGTPLPTPTPIPTQQINVAQTSSAPTIDGNSSDTIWSSAASSSLTRPIGTPSSEFAASYQTAWDNNNLYFLVKVTDASLSGHTDLVEIYVDPNYSGGTIYDSQDMQYQFVSNSTTPAQWNGGTQGTNTAGIVQANQTTSTGYQTEIAIPWAHLGVTTPSANAVLGLDLSVWQDSGSGVKKKLSWNTTADNAWTNPSVFGTATLQGLGGSSGTGLKGDYYNSADLSGSVVLSRTDATMNFDWGNGSPGMGVNPDNFSVRWTGQVQATTSGNYTFATTSDDGVRLWVNNQLVIDNWTDHPPTTNTSAVISLNAGQKYDIKMEFYERGGGAVAKLLWTPPSGSQRAIPQSQLFPD